jgi:hypothetical protein
VQIGERCEVHREELADTIPVRFEAWHDLVLDEVLRQQRCETIRVVGVDPVYSRSSAVRWLTSPSFGRSADPKRAAA